MNPNDPNPPRPASDAPLPDGTHREAAPEPADAPDPLAFQQAALLMLVFRFRGKRSLVASRTLSGRDFVAELRAHAPVLERHYPHRRVSAVEIVSYQHGRFYADPWPGGLRLLARVAPHVVHDPDVEEPKAEAAASEARPPTSPPEPVG